MFNNKFLLIALCILLGVACVNSTPRSNEASRPPAPQPTERASGPPSAEAEAKAAPVAEAIPDTRISSNPLQLKLPIDEEFLGRLLPAPKPSRYRKWKELGKITVGQSHLQQMEIVHAEQQVLVVSGMENSVRVYDRKTKKLLANHPVANVGSFEHLELAPWPDASLSTHCLIGRDDGIWLMDTRDGLVKPLAQGRSFRYLRWSPDNHILVAASSNRGSQRSALSFFSRSDPLGLDLFGEISFSERVDSWDLSRDNRYLAVTYYPSDTLELIDLHRGISLWRIPAPEYAGNVTFSPDSRTIAVGGSSLVVINTQQPERRNSYTKFQNNIGQVRISPSGDAIFTSSFDGKIRIFSYSREANKLRLEKTLAHAGGANVYNLRFTDDGWGLVSASGDRTIRFWGSGKAPNQDEPASGQSWQPLNIDQQNPQQKPEIILRDLSPKQRAQLLQELQDTPRHRPALLDAPARTSKIVPGDYACKVSREYKLRDCVVEKLPSEHTMLEIKEGNLIAVRGVLYDDGPVVRFEGWPTETRPFKCFTCQNRCFLRPEECSCNPHSIERTRDCLGQPVHAVFRGQGKHWKGVMLFFDHHDKAIPTELPPANFVFEGHNNQFVVVLKRR